MIYTHKDKKTNLKKLTLDLIGNALKDKGYNFDNEFYKETGEFAFLKVISGFKYGLVVRKVCEDRISAYLFCPTKNSWELFYATDGLTYYLTFTNENELVTILNAILNQFISKGDMWLKNHELQSFDVEKVYITIVDEFFQKYNFKRISTDNPLLCGGEVLYSNGYTSIKISHDKFLTMFTMFSIINGVESNILRSMAETDIEKLYAYSNEREYIENMIKWLEYLQKNWMFGYF